MLNIKKKIMRNKGIVNGLLWLIGTVFFIKFIYKDISIVGLVLGLFFILSIVWFVVSLFQIFHGLRFYFSTWKWSCFSTAQWIGYLSSIPLVIVSFLLYVNYLR